MLQKELSQMAQFQQSPQKYRLLGGALTLLWKNAFFGNRTIKRISLLYHSYSGNSPLFLHPEILEEISKYVSIPMTVRKSYEEYLASLKTRPEVQP